MVLILGVMVYQGNVSEAVPMATTFTYQGRLMDANFPADGLYDLLFVLFDGPESPGDGRLYCPTLPGWMFGHGR
jgi:hypothetical protein